MATRNKGKIFQYTVESLQKAVDAVHKENMAVSTASKIYGVPRTTLRAKLSGCTPLTSRRVGPEAILGAEMETKLVNWILEMARKGFPINKDGLFFSIQKIVTEGNIVTPFSNNVPGRKWFDGFLKRHPVVSQKHAEYINKARASVTEEKIRSWFREVENLLGEDAAILQNPQRVWNMDETAMFLSPKGSLILAEKGKQVYDVTSTSEKDNITTLISANANGDISTPLTLYKYERVPSWLKNLKIEGWSMGISDTGWMQRETFLSYIANVFYPYLIEKNIELPVIIFLDGHASHISLALSEFCKEHGIILVSLYPNTTHIMQPLDVAFFYPLKKAWKNMCKKWMIEHEGQTIQKKDVPCVLKEIVLTKDFSQTLANGFRKCGLVPFNPDAIDYSRCVRKTTNIGFKAIIESEAEIEVQNHLLYLEKMIGDDILTQFKNNDNYNWYGEERYKELFNLWRKIKYNEGELPLPLEENRFWEENDIIDFPFPEFDNEILENSNDIVLDQLAYAVNEQDQKWSKSEQKLEELTVQLTKTNEQLELLSNHSCSPEKDYLSELTNTIHDSPSKSLQENVSYSKEQLSETIETTIKEKPSMQELESNNKEQKIQILQNITLPSTKRKSIEDILRDVLYVPNIEPKTKKQNRIVLPPVLTSEKWLEIEKAQMQSKADKENEKQIKKQARQEKKNSIEAAKIAKEKKTENLIIEKKKNSETNDENNQPKLIQNKIINNINPEDFVLVELIYDENSKKKSKKQFVCQILNVTKNGYKVSCLRPFMEKREIFIFPQVKDEIQIKKDQILMILSKPYEKRGKYYFHDM